jgi:hypothetical protein
VACSLLVALTGCTAATAGAGASPSGSTAGDAERAIPTASTGPPPLTLTPVTNGASPEAGENADGGAASGEAAEPELLLEAGGLGVVVDDTRIEHLPFGTRSGTVRTAVARLLGPLKTTRRSDCEQGMRTSSTVGGLELLFRGGRFIGWTDTGTPGRRLTTGDGIGVGITVAALEDSGTDVTVHPLPGGGGEWTSGPGGLYGRTTSVATSGHVTLVSSGETCLTD